MRDLLRVSRRSWPLSAGAGGYNGLARVRTPAAERARDTRDPGLVAKILGLLGWRRGLEHPRHVKLVE